MARVPGAGPRPRGMSSWAACLSTGWVFIHCEVVSRAAFSQWGPWTGCSAITGELCGNATSYALVGPLDLETRGVGLRNLFCQVLQVFVMYTEV